MTEYVCCRCGESGLGRGADGKIYCHRHECIDWKAVRLARLSQIDAPFAVPK